jgi:Calx-beta domain
VNSFRFDGELRRGLVALATAVTISLALAGVARAGFTTCSDLFSFSPTSYSVHGGQAATLTVQDGRLGPTCGPSTTGTVDYQTSDGSAHAPADYTAASGTLTFVGTTSSSQTFPVQTQSTARAGVSFTVTLSNASQPGGSASVVPTASSATVTITDGAPFVTTGAATNITNTDATLNGTVNPNGAATTYYFQYGTSTSYGSQTGSQSAGSDTSDHPSSAGISGLAPSTTYHFRIVATNSDGTTFGSDATFITQASAGAAKSAPTVITGPAGNVKATSATLTGTVNPSGQSATYYFEYGTSKAYGHRTTSASAGAGSSGVAVSAALSGLALQTTYHYRIVASNPSGTTVGADRTFTTKLPPYAGAFAPAQQDPLTGPGSVKVLVTCPAGTYKTCTGTLQLSFGGTVISDPSFKLRSGQSARVTTRLTARGLALVHQHGALGVRARVKSRDAAGTRRTRNTTIVVLAPARTPVRVLPKFTG